jgi:hypothetical protein
MEKSKVFVSQEFRTNSLSITPGGHTVEVHYTSRIKVYDNIKNPTAYMKYLTATKEDPIIATYVDGKQTKHVWPKE